MKTLNFKNVGTYSEEASSRYEAITGNVIVRVYKCDYSKMWKVQFCTLHGYCLENQTGDFNAYSAYKGITKKALIDMIESTDLSYLQQPAINLDNQMREAGFIK